VPNIVLWLRDLAQSLEARVGVVFLKFPTAVTPRHLSELTVHKRQPFLIRFNITSAVDTTQGATGAIF